MKYAVNVANQISNNVKTPFKCATEMKTEELMDWKREYDAVIVSMKKLDVYKLGGTPKHRKRIDTKWVFKVK